MSIALIFMFATNGAYNNLKLGVGVLTAMK